MATPMRPVCTAGQDPRKEQVTPIMSDNFDKLVSILEAARDDVEKAEAGNKAATSRVRKAMQELKATAQDVRKEMLELRDSGGK